MLGHWGTTPGLNFIYVHLNRVIAERDVNVLYVCGPGHGGPGIVANVYLEGTYSEVYPKITQDAEGMKRLFKQFSFPGGIPSHVAPETPGSIHEGGELGYSLSHAFGAVFDNPDLIAACVVGDGEAETGPLATAWHGNKFLDPARDGAVLPILHLNGYKIANPCFLARIPEDELRKLMEGYGYTPYFVTGHDPLPVHRQMADALDACLTEIKRIQADARERLPRAPGVADDRAAYAEGVDVPRGDRRKEVRGVVAQPPGADDRGRYREPPPRARRVDEVVPAGGAVRRGRALKPELAALAPKGAKRMGANPHANGGLLLKDLNLPDYRAYAITVPSPAQPPRNRRASRASTCAT